MSVVIGRAKKQFGTRPVLVNGVKVAEVFKQSSCMGIRYVWVLKKLSDGSVQQCSDLEHVRSIAKHFT